ncbi:MAG: hypothetical protein M0R80_30045 [Proteobacteria bacterium]|nr:hypothetical protein [Pseudomonadota bacterium]
MRSAILTALVLLAAIAAPDAASASALGRPVGPVDGLACAPSDPDVAAAIVNGAVWLTRDGGATWRAIRRVEPLFGRTAAAATGEEESAEESEAEEAEEPGAPAGGRFALAVADRGDWAAARDGRWVAELGGRIEVHEERGAAALGLAFDAASRLWVAAGDRLIVAEVGRAARIVPLAGSVAPAPLPGSDAVVVPGARGIAELSTGTGGEIAVRVIGPPADAIAVSAVDGAVYAARRGAISRLADGVETPLAARAPARTSLLAFADGALFALSEGRWHGISSAGGSRLVAARAIAADALGRLWLGAELGPISPKAHDAASAAGPPPAPLPPSAVDFSRRPPPPCARPVAALLPDAKLSFGFGLREVASRAADGATLTAGSRSWLAVGLTLRWDLGRPAADGRCEARVERHAKREEKRLARAVELHAELARAEAALAAARGVAEALSASMAAEAASARIAGINGRAPDEKEKKK